ncbi:Nicotinamide riboside transporter PnuC [Pedobacter sp. Bi27]|uniref:nicotinamide riboside transporter PnuC n=1 Tax=unclassified Pedobacter TaxID=2628915 RepID=UPI001DB4ABAA|nr:MULTISPECIES: nicotinamide riboside transporter PnuC [unclassified Pedobacter]CAH0239503.1 Nicotinamide riboside transporter PnuC [Pedobacter sp. Bi27]CAH0252623.1 Nicotinamide riboside transporter PnuC [Pedobacter sp. Bi36]CAH0277311.1 Nicotinamide riboside transporter PnuC [Pedobacter sp. Bi126]
MNFQDWFRLFQEQILHTSLIEWLAVGFGVSEVLLAKKNSIWLYPTGIISILLSMFLLLNVKLYAETLLSIYYLVMSVYGWIIWKKRKQEGENQVSWSSNKELTIAVLISVIGFGVLYLVLRHYTDSDVPVFDAFVSSTAWAGMWLLAKRKIENWIFLNISNIVAIPLLFHKKLPLMACLTTFLFTVAIFGFLDWKKIIDKSRLKLA